MRLRAVAPAASAAAAGVLLMFSAVVFRESALPTSAELLALQQTGGGLQLPANKWNIVGGRDARLADQISQWNKPASLKAAGQAFVPATGTQQLAQVPTESALSKQIKTAVNTLRLSDFLTGVKPAVVQTQVQALYQKMDPKDTTGWMSREHVHRQSPAQVQARRVKTYKSMLEKELSTTRSQDSPKAQKVRKELRQLLKRKAAVKRSLDAEMRKDIRHTNPHVWTPRAVRNGDDADYLIHQIASPQDRHASYAQWLRSAKAGHHGRHHAVGKPRLSANGQLEWRKKVHTQLQQKQARLQALSQSDDTTHSRLQALSEDDNKVGASEIAMRQILGKAKKAAHTWVNDEDESHDEKKQAEVGRDFAAPHQALAIKRSANEMDSDVLSDAQEGVHPEVDTPESIEKRAAYKVSRWMGGGYVDVYGR